MKHTSFSCSTRVASVLWTRAILILAGMACLGACTPKAFAAQAALSGQAQVQGTALSPSPAGAAPSGAADVSGGYGGHVLEAVLPYWNPPTGLDGFARVVLRVSSNGRILSCEGQKAPGASAVNLTPSAGQSESWGLPAPLSPNESRLAEAACLAAGAVSSFAPPPYGQITEVYLVLGAGNVTKRPRPLAYVDQVLKQVQPHIVVPVRLGGTFSARVALRVEADGRISSVHMEQSSGRVDVDSAVLQALTVPSAIPIPPDGTARELVLTFTLRGE